MNSNQKPLLKRTFAILFMIVLYYTIQYATGKLAIFPHLSLPEDIKTHGNWVQLLDHHLWQMFIALLLIAIISKGNFKEWGFNFKNIDVSLRILKKFMFYFSVYFIGIGFLIQLFFVSATQLGHSFTIINIFGNIGFKGIISGLS